MLSDIELSAVLSLAGEHWTTARAVAMARHPEFDADITAVLSMMMASAVMDGATPAMAARIARNAMIGMRSVPDLSRAFREAAVEEARRINSVAIRIRMAGWQADGTLAWMGYEPSP